MGASKKLLGISELKPEQREAVQPLAKKNVFITLPILVTGNLPSTRCCDWLLLNSSSVQSVSMMTSEQLWHTKLVVVLPVVNTHKHVDVALQC